MKKAFLLLTALSFAAFFISLILHIYTDFSAALSLTITFGTIAYHFAMRLIVGYAVNAIFKNRMDYTKPWFRERRIERKLYRALGVKNWKKHIPSYNPENFDLSRRSVKEIIEVTCQAEVVHEIIMPCSLLPIAASALFGDLAVFLITSVIAFLIDGVFVVLQRYNRPRLMRLIREDE